MEQWRAKIGSFLQPVKSKTRLDTLKCNVKSLTLAIRLLLFFLLVAEGIEANPGPASRGRVQLEVGVRHVALERHGGAGRETTSQILTTSLNRQRDREHARRGSYRDSHL